MSILPINSPLANRSDEDIFELVVRATTNSLSENSARIYNTTLRDWKNWTAERGISVLAMTHDNVRDFLVSLPVTVATRAHKLAAIRKACRMLAILTQDDRAKAMYELLRELKVPHEMSSDNERVKSALTPTQSRRILGVWDEDDLQSLRNRAIVAVLLLTGIRRAECAVLRWDDIDLDNGTIHIRHGKGDKSRTVAMYGSTAMLALIDWREKTPGRNYVFCRVLKNGTLGPDKPISPKSIEQIVKQTGKMIGIEITPHTFRRTLATELLTTQTPVHDVQAQLGHSDPSTTLSHYAMEADARTRRKRGRVRFDE